MALAEVVHEAQEPCNEVLSFETMPKIMDRHEHLRQMSTAALLEQGVEQKAIKHEVYLNLRYRGSDTTLMILQPSDLDWKKAFISEHLREFSFVLPEDREVLVDDIRIRAIGISSENTRDNETLTQELRGGDFVPLDVNKVAVETVSGFLRNAKTRAN